MAVVQSGESEDAFSGRLDGKLRNMATVGHHSFHHRLDKETAHARMLYRSGSRTSFVSRVACTLGLAPDAEA